MLGRLEVVPDGEVYGYFEKVVLQDDEPAVVLGLLVAEDTRATDPVSS